MSYPRMATLVSKLSLKTQAGEVRWEETGEERTYQASFPGYAVHVFPRGEDYILQIFNDDGNLIEEVSDRDLTSYMGNAYIQMKELYELARRNAMGVEQALDKILSCLDGEDDDIPY